MICAQNIACDLNFMQVVFSKLSPIVVCLPNKDNNEMPLSLCQKVLR
jgi:hypothetical protein